MDPLEFFKTAEELLTKNSREADRRSAISRGYYCCYHLIRTDVMKIDARIRDSAGLGGTQLINHAKLCYALIGLGRTEVRIYEIGRKLDALRLARNKADYDIQKTFSEALAKQQLTYAKELCDEIEALGGATALVKQLEAYLKQLSP